MSTHSSRERNWKGDVPLVIEEHQHRWQMDANTSNAQEPKSYKRLNLIPLLGTIVSLAAISILIYLLLFSPVKTPVLAVSAGPYAWPLRLPAWRTEDLANFKRLHGKTIHCVDASQEWLNRANALADLERRSELLASQAARAGSCIVYLAMQGAVNDDGVPCLIPTQGDALAANTWISIEEIASSLLSSFPENVHCLLIIDPLDLTPNWRSGILDQTFTFRVSEWIEKAGRKNLSILIAAKDGQDIFAAPELGGSLFGREVQLGLAGGADIYPASPTNSTSPSRAGDGFISANELATFVSNRVQHWSKQFRNSEQTPLLLSGSNRDSTIVRASLANEKNQQLNSMLASTVPSPAIANDDMSSLWDMYHQLKKEKLYIDNPSRWTEMEFSLIRLEEANRAGGAFTELVKQQLYPQTKKALESYIQRATGPRASSILEREHFLAPTPPPIVRSGPWPSLTLKTLFGEIESTKGRQLLLEIPTHLANPGLIDLELMSSSVGILPSGSHWNEANFANLIKRYGGQTLAATDSQLQDVLALHLQIEQLFFDADVRVSRLRKPSLERIDTLRRQMEDLTFSGDQDRLNVAIKQLKQALEEFQTNENSLVSMADRAIKIRDRFLVTSPHILAWINSAHSLDDQAKEGESSLGTELPLAANLPKTLSHISNRKRAVIDRFLQLNNASEEFTHLLTDSRQNSDRQSERIHDFSELIIQDWTFLEQQWKLDTSDILSDPLRSQVLLSGLMTELQILIEDRDLRNQLRQASEDAAERTHSQDQSQLAASLKAKWKAIATSTSSLDLQVPLGNSSVTPTAKSWETWGEHPFLTYLNSSYRLLETDDSTESSEQSSFDAEARKIERGNNHLRKAFNAYPAFTPTRVISWSKNAGIRIDHDDTISVWDTAAYADFIERVVSPWSARRTDLHGFSLFKNIAIKELLCWYADRTLGDLYATISSEPVNAPFFEVAVNQLITEINRIPTHSPELDNSISNLQKRLSILQGSYRQSLMVDLKSDDMSLDGNRAPSMLSVETNHVALPDGGNWAPELPTGNLSAFLRDHDGNSVTLRVALDMPTADTSVTVPVHFPLGEDPNKRTEVIVTFRGHEFKKEIRYSNFTVVEYLKDINKFADVALFGDKPKQPSIMLVLDCSSSMSEPLPLEAIDSKTQSKLEAAKASILQLLDQLATFPDSRVGVSLFGHRIGWSRPASDSKVGSPISSRLLLQPDYAGSIPDGLTPSRDIETVLTLGRFDPQFASQLNKRLSRVIPWGQSPIYLSIIEAYSAFEADSANDTTSKCVVVITDGDNFQFNAVRSPGGSPEIDTSLNDVLQAWKQRKIPTFILGVGIAAHGNEETLANLNHIAAATGGEYYDIQNRSDLLHALLERLSRGEYSVVPSQTALDPIVDSPSTQETAKLNKPLHLSLPSNVPQSFELQFQSVRKTFEVFGGESLQFVLNESGHDLITVPFLANSPKSATLRKGNSTERRIARAHRPTIDKSSVVFPISLQDPQNFYTKRPAEVWIEIQPQSAERLDLGEPYVFYDLPWKVGVPIPVVECRAVDWPESASRASLRVWYSDAPAIPVLSLSAAEILANPEKFKRGIEVPSIPGYSVQLNVQTGTIPGGIRSILIKEIISSELSDSNRTKVAVVSPYNPLPMRVRHKFDRNNLGASHSFEFMTSADDMVISMDSIKVELFTKGNITNGVWALEDGQPIELELHDAADFLPKASSPVSPTLQTVP